MVNYTNNPIFSMDKYFENIKKHTSHNQEILSIFKEYECEFKERTNDFLFDFPSKAMSSLKEHPDHFVYERVIELPNKGHFKLLWDITIAESVIKRDKIKPEMFPIQELHVDLKGVDENYLPVAIHNKKPIIAVTYAPFENSPYHNFIIDGAHRCAAKLNKALKENNSDPHIKTCLLNTDQTLESLEHEFYRYFYKMHTNIVKLGRYALEDLYLTIPLEEYKNNLYVL